MSSRISTISLWIAAAGLTSLLLAGGRLNAPAAPEPEPDRSPIDLAVTQDGRWALTANSTAGSVSLLDLIQSKVAAEVKVGQRPFGIALSRDGRKAVVSNLWSNSVTVLNVDAPKLTVAATVPIGDEPRGVAISPDGTRAFVALAGEGSVAALDLKTLKPGPMLAVGTEPWHLALTPDGSRLAVGSSRSQEVTVVDAAGWKLLHSVRLRGKNGRHIGISPDGEHAFITHISERGRPTTKDNIDLGWVVGNRMSRVPLNEPGSRETITLDTRGKAVADVDGLAVSPDGQTIALSAAGTHELLVLRLPLPFVAFGGPGDHIEPDLLNDPRRFKRIPVGGRPVGMRFLPSGTHVAVANYLSNSVQIVDVREGTITSTISVGGPAQPSLARRGEAIFLDGNRCFNQWYTCNSCHVEGHTNGSTFDTFNDGSYESPKKTLSLRNVTRTPPWTWHGWRKDLDQLIHDSMTKSMQGPEPAIEDIRAVRAYLETLKERPNPSRTANGTLTVAAKRGEAVFNAKQCQTCHAPPFYSAEGVYTVGVESANDVYKGFNPPSLLGVRNRAPYMHNGESPGLTEVLTKHHRPSQLTGAADCTPQELADLIAFLKSL